MCFDVMMELYRTITAILDNKNLFYHNGGGRKFFNIDIYSRYNDSLLNDELELSRTEFNVSSPFLLF